MLLDPGGVGRQGADERAVQAAWGTEVDVLDRGSVAEFGLGEAASQGALLPPSPLLIDQQGEAFLEAQIRQAVPLSRILSADTSGSGRRSLEGTYSASN